MRYQILLTVFMLFVTPVIAAPPISEATQACLLCHEPIHSGIVGDWRTSRHFRVTPADGLKKPKSERRVSSENIPEDLLNTAVGCAECHMLRPDEHADTFDHAGYKIHVVVSPEDCRTCHREEVEQYGQNLMSQAYGNLADNAVFGMLEHSIIGKKTFKDGRIHYDPADDVTKEEACYYCHGTKLTFKGLQTREHPLLGEMELPVIEGWPNQGVGRVNLDGSLGACTPCHARHAFSIEVARKPHTCRECHVGPDVPAYKVYASSKHGNIYSSKGHEWNFESVPWHVGQDFTAPTCATCHISALATPEGEEIVPRSHAMADRMPWRLFGLIYAHSHPKSPDTTIIRNAADLPLPTDFDGSEATDFLIGTTEREKRQATMSKVCLTCHDASWVKRHWERLEHTIRETNSDTATATAIMAQAWQKGLAKGVAQGQNPFDEFIERKWGRSWLIYGNTIRFASAMAGGGDYGVFANGRYEMSILLTEMADWVRERSGKQTTD